MSQFLRQLTRAGLLLALVAGSAPSVLARDGDGGDAKRGSEWSKSQQSQTSPARRRDEGARSGPERRHGMPGNANDARPQFRSDSRDSKPREERRAERRQDDRQQAREARQRNWPDDGRPQFRDERRADRPQFRDERRREDGRQHVRDERRRDWRIDHRHRDWVRPGRIVRTMPWGYREIRHSSHRYFFADGLWYQPWGSSYISIGAPLGVVISTLPLGFVTYNIGGYLHYRYADTWYRRHDSGYIVVERPANAPVSDDDSAADSDGDALYAYPRDGQTEERQAQDRFECHEWAVGQTGYDPSLVSPAGSDAGQLDKRPDYLRAITACLESRGYTVR